MRKLITALLTAVLLTGAWLASEAQNTSPVPTSFLIAEDIPDDVMTFYDSLNNAKNRRDRQIKVWNRATRTWSGMFPLGKNLGITVRAFSTEPVKQPVTAFGVVLLKGRPDKDGTSVGFADTANIGSWVAEADTLHILTTGTYTQLWSDLGPATAGCLMFVPNDTLNDTHTYVEGVYFWDRY